MTVLDVDELGGAPLGASQLEALRGAASAKLDAQAQRARRYQFYYDGEAEIVALLATAERQTFRKLLDESGCDWCELIVNAVAERLSVVGFRWGAASDQAWQIWQASQMDADAELVQTDALVTGQSFVLVQPDDDSANPTGVRITAESPFEATILYRPGDRRERVAGYKRFAGIDPQDYPWPAWMGEPLGAGTTEVLITAGEIAIWQASGSDPVIMPNPAGVVGMIEICPQPRTWGPPRSELTPAIPIQDRICTTLFNRLVATDYSAFRQIWAAGVRIPQQMITTTDPATGEPVEQVQYNAPFDVGANRLLVTENPAARFGSFAESTLQGYLSSVEQDVDMMAAITQTPTYYFRPMANLSADAIKAAEAGLVAKVSRRALHIGEGWETVMRTAFAIARNDAAAAEQSAEIIWRDFETRSEAQLVDGLVKMRTLGVPLEALWAKWGATPSTIAEWRQMREAELSGPQLAPQPVPTTASGRSSAPGPQLPVRE